ncbi:hypothetical protein KEM55_003950 [Ascosphaera atra]|nr:hypothetical protein KEM55_003950 [Ascosphaera atra]
MRYQALLPLVPLFGTLANAATNSSSSNSNVKIILGNDDGWAEQTIRTFYQTLKGAGYDVFESAPANGGSGEGPLDTPPEPLGDKTCQFNSCPTGSPAEGKNSTDSNITYVNSTPVGAIKYGIQHYPNGNPDLAVTGPNTLPNLGITGILSGTENAAAYAAKQGIPAIAFSGFSKSIAWNETIERQNVVNAEAATNFTSVLIKSGTPYLPSKTFLNVNFPVIGKSCQSSQDIKYVLARTNPDLTGNKDVNTCGNNGKLPYDVEVVLSAVVNDIVDEKNDRCLASVSLLEAKTMQDADADQQKEVMNKLSSILTCM